MLLRRTVKMKLFFVPFFILAILVLSSFAQTNSQSLFVKANGINIHYLEWGKGKETIILIHGLSDTAESWKAFASLLANKYRVIAFDRRGVGKTDKPISGYDMKTLSEDISAAVKELRLNKIHLVGHSAGANAAMTFAADNPDKLRSLTLIEGGFWEKREGEVFSCPDPKDTECLIEQAVLRGNYAYDAEKLYNKVTTPTLLVLAVPPIVPAEFAKQFEDAKNHVSTVATKKLKNGKFVLIKNSEHWVYRDQPQVLSQELLNFFKINQ